jgi:hypothetical protein
MIYRPGDQLQGWLNRHGTGIGHPDTKYIPCYLLIVGKPGPRQDGDQVFIPFEFQYLLDIQRGVGRLYFETLAEYKQYARSVVVSESGHLVLPQRVAYFATKHELDMSTIRMSEELVLPLITSMRNSHTTWDITAFLEQDATRTHLHELLGGSQPPGILFTATHGLGLPSSDENLVEHQGAIVTQDWTGFGAVKRDHWFAGEDLTIDDRLLGILSIIAGGTGDRPAKVW